MSDYLLPPSLNIARATFRYLESTGVSRNPYTGAVRTASLGGDRLGCSLETTMVGGGSSQTAMQRAQLLAFIASMRGRQNRAYMWDRAYTPRGSFPMTELISNGDFSNGTTGWVAGSDVGTLTVADRALRVKRNATTPASPAVYGSQSVSYAAYTPYAWRFAVSAIAGSELPYATAGGALSSAGMTNGASLSAPGITTGSVVSGPASSDPVYLDNSVSTGGVVGGYFDVAWASMSRCLLADAPDNLLTNNDALTGGAWTKTALTATASAVGPYGTSDAFTITPNTSSTDHAFSQTMTVVAGSTLMVCGVYKANGYNFVRLQLAEASGSTLLHQVFNMNTGAVGASGSTGANWADARSYIAYLGNGFYFCCLIGRLTNAATSVTASSYVQNADSTTAFAGNGTSGIFAWLPTCVRSGVPCLPVLNSTGAAVSGQSFAAGSTSINVKGGLTTMAGALLPSDQFEVLTTYGSELKMVTASLDLDAAGRGRLQFSPPLRGTLLANQPIIVNRPMGRFVYSGNAMEWPTEPGILTSTSFDFEEAVG